MLRPSELKEALVWSVGYVLFHVLLMLAVGGAYGIVEVGFYATPVDCALAFLVAFFSAMVVPIVAYILAPLYFYVMTMPFSRVIGFASALGLTIMYFNAVIWYTLGVFLGSLLGPRVSPYSWEWFRRILRRVKKSIGF